MREEKCIYKYGIEDDGWCDESECACNLINNCYYKQRQQLQAENVRLKQFLFNSIYENKNEPDKLIIEANRAFNLFDLQALQAKEKINE